MTQSFDTLLDKFKVYLAANPFEKEPVGLYQPVDYILNLGGKRIRPVLLLMAGNLFTDDIEKSLPAAYAIEIFHCFSLVHDDIMDAAPLRRGKPSVHVKYSSNSGILSGDVMLIHAYGYLLKSTMHMDDPRPVLNIFNRVAIEVCEGQQMDMDFEKEDQVRIDEYLKMIELKTSVLVGAAMQIGALLGGANDEEASSMYQFGRNLGIAFQIQDDYLDTYGDPKKFGKKVGGDIIQHKKTILYLKALESANDQGKIAIQVLYNSNDLEEDDKIREVKKVFDSLNIQVEINRMKEFYQKTAFEFLENLKVDKGRKDVMKQFALALMNRQS